ncbi:hypothetical protein G4B88_029737 [Cannabis sativa]|uniref:Small ribosomal subunit protein uS15 N-terminal domain-containing protein n=1 Tax=Cannabis sativa TaxID=3483 RepID=A0A7J6GEW6_CANSA|nr:hypothetical protein G4B88_029737 [Cannabis sativa]
MIRMVKRTRIIRDCLSVEEGDKLKRGRRPRRISQLLLNKKRECKPCETQRRQNTVESLGQGGHSALGRLPLPRDHRSLSWRSHSHRRLFFFPYNLCLLSPLELARENKVSQDMSLSLQEAPLKISSQDVKENICKFAKKGLTPSQIGVILTVKSVTGSKILRVLKAHVAETAASTILDIRLEWSWLNQVDQSLKFKGEVKMVVKIIVIYDINAYM